GNLPRRHQVRRQSSSEGIERPRRRRSMDSLAPWPDLPAAIPHAEVARLVETAAEAACAALRGQDTRGYILLLEGIRRGDDGHLVDAVAVQEEAHPGTCPAGGAQVELAAGKGAGRERLEVGEPPARRVHQAVAVLRQHCLRVRDVRLRAVRVGGEQELVLRL